MAAVMGAMVGAPAATVGGIVGDNFTKTLVGVGVGALDGATVGDVDGLTLPLLGAAIGDCRARAELVAIAGAEDGDGGT